MTVDLNAIVLRRRDAEDRLVFWFEEDELHILDVDGKMGARWVIAGGDAEWLLDGLAALRERGVARMKAVQS